MSPNAGGGGCGVPAVHIYRAQVNFGDLTPYLAYALMAHCMKGILDLLCCSKGCKYTFFKAGSEHP
jgi:hypothetical protein